MRILVVGAGSVGTVVAAALAASGREVVVYCRPAHVAPIEADGLAVTGLREIRARVRATADAAAIDQGYFESAGLDVTLIEGGPDIAPEVAGSAVDGPEFTISWVPRVLAARATASTDLVDIGQIFHRSSTLTMAFREEDVSAPADFRDKRVGVLPGGDRLEVIAAAKKGGVALPGDGQVVDLGTGVDPLLTGEVDVAQVTIHDTYARVLEATDRRGKPYQVTDFDVINVEDEGTAMLQDAVFARASWLAREGNEAIATAFIKASALGWMYCRDHPSDCVDSVVAAGESIGLEPGASPSPAPPSPTGSAETRLRPGQCGTECPGP